MKSRKKRAASRPAVKALPPLTRLPTLDVQQRYTVPEALAYLRTSRKTFYTLITQGRLSVIKEGNGKRKRKGRTYVPGSEIARLSRVPAPAAAAPTAPSVLSPP